MRMMDGIMGRGLLRLFSSERYSKYRSYGNSLRDSVVMAFPFPMGLPGPTEMMEFLAQLSEDEQEEFMQCAKDTAEKFQEQTLQTQTQEGLIQRFKTMRAKFGRPGGIYADFGADVVSIAFTFDDAKPKTDLKSLRTLKPMIVKELDVGTTHYGRYLCGFVAIDDAFFGLSSLSLLLEDVTGTLVEIAVYGLVDTTLPSHEKQHIVARKFPKGQAIVVFEPYYKVRTDGSLGIRVEQATEIIPWRDAPTDLLTWKKLGNDFFCVLNTQNEGCGALACYRRAMQATQPEIHTLALLLSNLATCRFKMGDFATSIQLSGVAAHLDPSYFKAWFRLASALIENGSKAIAARVVAHVQRNLTLAPQELQLLQTCGTMHVSTNTFPFDSYAKWCVSLGSPGFLLANEKLCQGPKDADSWRKEGSGYFSSGDYFSAEACYRKGLALSTSYCCNVSIVLNNIAAVFLTMRRENRDVPGISVGELNVTSAKALGQMSNTESALLNCSVAGIIDPLNHKAWVRRARCLQYMGISQEDCIADLKTVDASVTTQVCSEAENAKRVQKFKHELSDNIQRRIRCCTDAQPACQVSDVSTEEQRQQRHACHPKNLFSAIGRENEHEDDDMDECIARMENLEATICFASSASMSCTGQKPNLPREVMMFVKDSLPKIYIEFPMLRGWPVGIDPVFARKNLYRAYLDARASPWVRAWSMRTGSFFENIGPADLVKRWHGTMPLQMLADRGDSLKFGDILARDQELKNALPAYDARIRSNFANNPNRAEAYFLGTTHVAIGFNDLSSLVTATLRDESHNGMPLKFMGFEMSEFAVAKCKVVAQMLASPDVSISSVMEVWLSSTWACSTLKEFRKCVKTVLEALHGRDSNPKVVSYLRHWASVETISAAKAHAEFFANLRRYTQRVLIELYNFRRKIDRLDLTQYMLTGEVRASSRVMNMLEKKRSTSGLQAGVVKNDKVTSKKKRRGKKKKRKQGALPTPSSGNTPLVGSLTMWNVPPGAPPLEEDVAFNTVDFLSILKDFEELEKKQKSSTDELSVVDLFEIHIMRNLDRLRELMIANKLTIEVNYGVVKAVRGEAATDPENLNLLARIALLRPYTISWSNVLDYFVPADFHDLARRCSVYGECVHYGYSMNWTTQVCGASLLDYTPTCHKALIDSILDAALGFSSGTRRGEPSLLDLLTALGMDKLLLLPYRGHPLDSTGYILACIHKQKWIDYFMEEGKLSAEMEHRLGTMCTLSNCGLQEGAMELAIPSPLQRSSLTLYMSWCYDPKLRLRMIDHSVSDTDALAEMMQQWGCRGN